jgi:hypothetical protein
LKGVLDIMKMIKNSTLSRYLIDITYLDRDAMEKGYLEFWKTFRGRVILYTEEENTR